MNEPGAIYRGLLFHFGSGDALAIGLLGVALGVWADSRHSRHRRPALVALLLVLGGLWIVLSSWPSLVMQAGLLLSLAVWLIARIRQTSAMATDRTRRLVYGMCLLSLISEWPYQVLPQTPKVTALAVIGDSVTAGLNDSDVTWPQVIAKRYGITVHDASQQGATCHSAQQQVQLLGGRGEAVLLEIGGNDVLEYVPVEFYAEELDQLLRDVRTAYPTQPVVMCELPLPPLGHRYGWHQRRLANRYDVRLIPKRKFMQVLTAKQATVDGIHLSNTGQQLMAALMARVLSRSITSNAMRYHRYEPTSSWR
ncbi:hypothetical protein GC163_06750 [bacterium]|nr:hypothetical protein [bacterium]